MQDKNTDSSHRSPRVLLVEDETFFQYLAISILEQLGCRVDIATNGQEAVDRCQTQHYDLLLMDLRLPALNGYDAAAAIRQQGINSQRMPIIGVSSTSLIEERDKCLAMGMDDFLVKPLELATVGVIFKKFGIRLHNHD